MVDLRDGRCLFTEQIVDNFEALVLGAPRTTPTAIHTALRRAEAPGTPHHAQSSEFQHLMSSLPCMGAGHPAPRSLTALDRRSYEH